MYAGFKKTGDVRLVYLGKKENSNENKDEPDIYNALAIVEGRDAAANIAKAKHQYKTESGKLPDEISRLNNRWDEQEYQSTDKSQIPKKPTNVPLNAIFNPTTKRWVDKMNRKLYNDKGEELKRGN